MNVEQLCRWSLPAGTEILGGAEGMARDVGWVVMLRQRAPAFGRLSGGELALVPLAGLARLEPPVKLADLLRQLAAIGIAAVAIQGEPPPEAGALADRLGVPLLRLPADQSLPALEQELNRRLIEWQGELRHQTERVYRQLMELALSHRGQPAIIERLSRLLGRPASLEDGGGRLIGFTTQNGAPPERDDLPALITQTQPRADAWAASAPLNAADPPVQQLDLPDGQLCRLVAPVVHTDQVAGWVSVWLPPAQVGALERFAVARGAAACAIDHAWRRAVDQARDELLGELAHDLIQGRYGDPRPALERAARLGFDLEQPQVVLAVDTVSLAADDLGARLGKRVLWSAEAGTLALIVPVQGLDGTAAKAAGAHWRRTLAALGLDGVAIGIGRVCADLGGLPRAWQEAAEALALGRRLFGADALTYFGDLGLYRFLLAAHDREELARFHDEFLGELAAYDRRHKSELLPTLEAYFASGRSPKLAASVLHTHRNTVLYRLDRIQAISGRDLSDPETCLALHLALRVHQVLAARDAA